MTMYEFWQQDSSTVTVYLIGILILAVIVGYITYYFIKKHPHQIDTVKSLPNTDSMFPLYVITRYSLVLLGGLTLFLTFFSGLLPFENHIDQNLGLGGLLLFFMWPLVILQMGIGLIPLEKKIQGQQAKWIILGIIYVIALKIDFATINLVYNW